MIIFASYNIPQLLQLKLSVTNGQAVVPGQAVSVVSAEWSHDHCFNSSFDDVIPIVIIVIKIINFHFTDTLLLFTHSLNSNHFPVYNFRLEILIKLFYYQPDTIQWYNLNSISIFEFSHSVVMVRLSYYIYFVFDYIDWI